MMKDDNTKNPQEEPIKEELEHKEVEPQVENDNKELDAVEENAEQLIEIPSFEEEIEEISTMSSRSTTIMELPPDEEEETTDLSLPEEIDLPLPDELEEAFALEAELMPIEETIIEAEEEIEELIPVDTAINRENLRATMIMELPPDEDIIENTIEAAKTEDNLEEEEVFDFPVKSSSSEEIKDANDLVLVEETVEAQEDEGAFLATLESESEEVPTPVVEELATSIMELPEEKSLEEVVSQEVEAISEEVFDFPVKSSSKEEAVDTDDLTLTIEEKDSGGLDLITFDESAEEVPAPVAEELTAIMEFSEEETSVETISDVLENVSEEEVFDFPIKSSKEEAVDTDDLALAIEEKDAEDVDLITLESESEEVPLPVVEELATAIMELPEEAPVEEVLDQGMEVVSEEVFDFPNKEEEVKVQEAVTPDFEMPKALEEERTIVEDYSAIVDHPEQVAVSLEKEPIGGIEQEVEMEDYQGLIEHPEQVAASLEKFKPEEESEPEERPTMDYPDIVEDMGIPEEIIAMNSGAVNVVESEPEERPTMDYPDIVEDMGIPEEVIAMNSGAVNVVESEPEERPTMDYPDIAKDMGIPEEIIAMNSGAINLVESEPEERPTMGYPDIVEDIPEQVANHPEDFELDVVDNERPTMTYPINNTTNIENQTHTSPEEPAPLDVVENERPTMMYPTNRQQDQTPANVPPPPVVDPEEQRLRAMLAYEPNPNPKMKTENKDSEGGEEQITKIPKNENPRNTRSSIKVSARLSYSEDKSFKAIWMNKTIRIRRL